MPKNIRVTTIATFVNNSFDRVKVGRLYRDYDIN